MESRLPAFSVVIPVYNGAETIAACLDGLAAQSAAPADFEIVVVMRERTPMTASLLARLPNLRLLVTTGMRNASIDLAAAAEHGIVVCGTASHSEPPVELTWALILGLARHVVTENNALRAGKWQVTVGADLAGRTLGLIGLGKVTMHGAVKTDTYARLASEPRSARPP